jgi:hypothetical protein
VYELFDRVALNVDVSAHELHRGDVGIVVETYPATDGLEVEFFDDEGETIAVLTLDAAEVRKLTSSELKARSA